MKAVWHPISEKPAVACQAIIRATPVVGIGVQDKEPPFLLPAVATWQPGRQRWIFEINSRVLPLDAPSVTYHWALEDDLVALI